jgi:hypothetical protein
MGKCRRNHPASNTIALYHAASSGAIGTRSLAIDLSMQHRYMEVEAMAELLKSMIEINGGMTPRNAPSMPSRAASS